MRSAKIIAGFLAATCCGMAQGLPMELTGNGIVWTWTSGNVGDNTGVISLSADVSGSTLGASPAYLNAFALKLPDNIAITSASITSPASGWTFSDKELNASGCGGGSHAFNMCFLGGQPLAVTDLTDFAFDIAFDLAGTYVLPDALHLKVQWANTATPSHPNQKIGDLISADFMSTTPPCEGEECSGPPSGVPVPGTLFLLSLGLLGLRFRSKA
jgi:hypothetical protein